MRINFLYVLLLIMIISCESDQAPQNNQGQGGSLTRFAINGNYLYVVDNSQIQVFDISSNSFEHVKDVPVNFGLETIFSRGEYLYLGANDAMYIYSIANPEDPGFVFRYSHIVSCDPVVVQGTRAYVTLRSGTACNRGANRLEILDISEPNNPTLVANYPMKSPHGLGVDGDYLFICEGEYGLKMFDISNEHQIVLLSHKNDMHAYDVIPKNGVLILTGEDGVFQFKYGIEPPRLEMLSKIPVYREEV